MQSIVAILDDEPDRLSAMSSILSMQFPTYGLVTFDNAPDMISWLEGNLSECTLICLDHDLGPNRSRGGDTFDPGIGRDVADWLADQSPACPVLIHTTNALAAPGMLTVLEEGGWHADRVTPYDDLAWVNEVWIQAVQDMLN